MHLYQLIEAGVDLSFGCVIRSFAGLDSVAQAAGRCNRNGESACKNVYVIRLREESLGKLPEISQARDAAEAVLYETKSGEDLLAPAVMDKFYHRYYQTESQQEVMEIYFARGAHDDFRLVVCQSAGPQCIQRNYRKRHFSGEAIFLPGIPDGGNEFSCHREQHHLCFGAL